MSHSVCKLFRKWGRGRKASKNSALQLFILSAVREREREKMKKENRNLVTDRTSTTVSRGAGEGLWILAQALTEGKRNSATCAAVSGTDFLVSSANNSPTEKSTEGYLVLEITVHSLHTWSQNNTCTKQCQFQPQKLIFPPATGTGWQERGRMGGHSAACLLCIRAGLP